MKLQQVLNNLLKCKSPQELIDEGSNSGLKKTLNVFDLIILGIGAVVGTGIFTIIGSAIAGSADGAGAGPAVVISMILAAVASVFSALSYSEIAAMIPVAGSAYTYTYATMGEFMAWMVGWILMLEYAIGKRGQTLDSLQYLISLFVNKKSESYIRVKLDTENYRARRKDTLENLAKNISFKVKRTRRPFTLEPMNPYERRIIHSALQNDKYVATRSEGEEPYRKVVIYLKKNA